MVKAFGGTPAEVQARYRESSFLPNLSLVPPTLRVAIVSAVHDQTMPPKFQEQIADALKGRSIPVQLLHIDGEHGVPAANFYLQALNFVLKADVKPNAAPKPKKESPYIAKAVARLF